jgi:uncharacterized delta-60 repeat protein
MTFVRAAVRLALVALALSAPVAAAHPGQVDRGFGEDGHRVVALPDGFEPVGVHLYPDGRIVALGHYGDGRRAVVRVGDGQAPLGTQASGFPAAFAELPDGGILVPGSAPNQQFSQDSVVSKLLPDGSPDRAWGRGGTTAPVDFAASTDRFSEVALQPDARIVATGGAAEGYSGLQGTVARFLPDGSVDTSFMQTGFSEPHDLYEPVMLAAPDGRIVLLGNELDCVREGSDCNVPSLIYGMTFGTGSVPVSAPSVVFRPRRGFRAQMSGAALLDDGRVLVVGQYERVRPKRKALLVAVLDASLRVQRWRVIPQPSFNDVQVAGFDRNGRAILAVAGRRVALRRLDLSPLRLDRSFGSHGATVVMREERTQRYVATALPDGRILVLTYRPGAGELRLSRYLGGDDRTRPRIATAVEACRDGGRLVRVRVRDASALARVSVHRGKRTLVRTSRSRLRLRVVVRTRVRLRLQARDVAGNVATTIRWVPGCR